MSKRFQPMRCSETKLYSLMRMKLRPVGVGILSYAMLLICSTGAQSHTTRLDRTGSTTNNNVVVADNSTYDPQSASEATGQTLRQLDDQQHAIVGLAAKFMTMMNYCNYSYRPGANPIIEFVEQYGVHGHDFQLHIRRFRGPTMTELRNASDWRYFCGTAIYNEFGPGGGFFGSGGRYPNIEPWIRRPEVTEGMTRAKLEEEIKMTAAYFGSFRCNIQYDEDNDQARREAFGMDSEWNIAADRHTAPILNEAMFRLGQESLMNCSQFRNEYREYLLR